MSVSKGEPTSASALRPPKTGRVPDDPAAFVERAEALSNGYDADGAVAVYARDAVLESVTDGTVQILRGSAELRRGIGIMFAVSRQRRLQLTKELLAVSEDTVVNIWQGTIGDGKDARGVEIWRFDADQRVCQHRMFTALDARSDKSLVQRLRVLFLYPRTALSFFRAERSAE